MTVSVGTGYPVPNTCPTVVWDNRCTMHRAMPYEDMRYPRDMRSMRTNDPADGAMPEPVARNPAITAAG